MPRTLFAKLLLVFLMFGAMMTLVFIFVMRGSHELYHREFDQTINRDLAQQYIDAQFFRGAEPLNGDTIHLGIARLAEINPDIDIYLLDAGGAVVGSSVPPSERKRNRIEVAPVRAFIGGEVSLPILGADPRDASDRKVFSAAPLKVPNCPAEFLYIVLHRQDHEPSAQRLKTNYAIGEGAGVVLSVMAFAIVSSLLMLRSLTRRLGSLDAAMQRFRKSNFSALPADPAFLPADQSDEIERLGEVFGELAERVQTQFEELKRTDNMRRELLANVSHDLRTPLATLQVHLESMALQQSTLTASEREEYLSIAFKQTRHLGRLIDQLMHAAKLDSNQVTVQAEPFQLADLAQDVIRKFELAARERGIELQTDIAHEPPLVYADIGLIERVLDNLIENALQHAPASSFIRIGVSIKERFVRCSVSDAGAGIPESERHKIFERFYRIDKSRSGDMGNAGLGLSIVKQILTLHGCDIHVESESGRGTVFWFDLPVANAGHRTKCA
ncbi:MAG: sensor histidine kinase [Steroidobacteraceae bacterium]